MIKSELSITIDAPPEKVFARIDDYMHAEEWVPGLVEVKNIKGQGKGQTHQMVYKMMGIRIESNCSIPDYVPNERLVMEFAGGISGVMTYTLKPVNAGCHVSVTYDYGVPIPLVGKVAEKLLKKRNEREFRVCLENLKELVEAENQASVD